MQDFRREANSSKVRGLLHRLKTWKKHFKSQPVDMHLLDEKTNFHQSVIMPNEACLNTSCNMSSSEDDCERYPDTFTKTLADEGLLTYSNPISKIPVLTVCHGFLDAELAAVNMSQQDEKRYRESIQHLPEDKQTSYLRLFSTHYPMEPLVDGLPESIWLECVEPTLSILKALNSLKRRRSNLSIRKCTMEILDSNAACRGDTEPQPHMFNPFVNGYHQRLMRVQLLALEGALFFRNNQESRNEAQEGRNQMQLVLRNPVTLQRRRLQQYRPFNVLWELQRNLNHFENNVYDMRDMINSYEYNMVEFQGI